MLCQPKINSILSFLALFAVRIINVQLVNSKSWSSKPISSDSPSCFDQVLSFDFLAFYLTLKKTLM